MTHDPDALSRGDIAGLAARGILAVRRVSVGTAEHGRPDARV